MTETKHTTIEELFKLGSITVSTGMPSNRNGLCLS